ncbi:MAG: hypothetical protein HXX16_14000 [Bacteroidales bacterium]|nr:hypothetical protein [Bacteroidales bacterium]
MKLKLAIFSMIFLILFNFITKSQNNTVFPFEICQDRIVIHYPVKDTSLKFIFDSGSNLNIINLDKAHLLNAKFSDEVNKINVSYFDLKLKRTNYIDENIFGGRWCSIDKYLILKTECNIDGLVGASELLKKYTIDICFAENLIKIIDRNAKPTCSANIEVLAIDKPSKGYETDVSLFTGNAVSVSGEILLSDTSKINTQFLIDTGSKFEIALMVTDSSIIRNLSCGKEKYDNFIGLKKVLDYTFLKYRLFKNQYSSNIKAFIFYQEPNIFSIFGSRKIGALLGIPFLKRYESVIIDNFEKKLYLVN